MARPMRPLVRSGGYYPSNRWIPLVYPGGYTTMNGGGEPTPSVVWVTVSGASPLSLVNAAASDIRSLIQTGKCVQSGTPTPSAPVDIVCNNGALRMVHRSGLPSGYKLLEYVGSSGAAYVVTDVFLASTDVIEAEFRNNSTTGFGSLYGVFRLGDSSALYANQTYYGYNESNDKVDTGLRVNTGWHSSRHDFVNGTLTIDDTTVTFTPWEFANTTKNAVLARYYNNSYGYIWKGFIRKFKVTRGGEVICDLLPAKNEQDEAGLYDLVSGTFYTATSGTLVAGDEVDDYELRVVGTPEVLTALQNLLTRNGETTGKIINADGTVSDNSNYCISAPFTLSAGNYICTWNYGSAGTRPFSVFACDADGTPKTDGRIFYQPRAGTGINTGEFTVEADTLAVSSYRSNVTDSTIYRTPQTASVVNLYAVGDYADTQDIISGLRTHKVGVKVLDGTETGWTQATTSTGVLRFYLPFDGAATPTGAREQVASTHFSYAADGQDLGIAFLSSQTRVYFIPTDQTMTGTTWKAFLAAQYAAGTPVIVMYPLAEETTESVTPQPIRTEEGTNTVSVTSNVDPVELSVEYAQPESGGS